MTTPDTCSVSGSSAPNLFTASTMTTSIGSGVAWISSTTSGPANAKTSLGWSAYINGMREDYDGFAAELAQIGQYLQSKG